MIELLSIVCLIMIIMPCNHVEADHHDEAAGDYYYDYKRGFFPTFSNHLQNADLCERKRVWGEDDVVHHVDHSVGRHLNIRMVITVVIRMLSMMVIIMVIMPREDFLVSERKDGVKGTLSGKSCEIWDLVKKYHRNPLHSHLASSIPFHPHLCVIIWSLVVIATLWLIIEKVIIEILLLFHRIQVNIIGCIGCTCLSPTLGTDTWPCKKS